MRIRCSKCQVELNAKQREAAFKVRCPKCGHVFVVPAAAPAELPSPITPAAVVPKPVTTAVTESPPPTPSVRSKKPSPETVKSRSNGSVFPVAMVIVVATVLLVGAAGGWWYYEQTRPVTMASLPTGEVKSFIEKTPKGAIVDDDDDPVKPKVKKSRPKTTPPITKVPENPPEVISDPKPVEPKLPDAKTPVTNPPVAKPTTPVVKKPLPAFQFQRVETAAVIDRSGTPAGTLFEARMLQDDRLKWVERSALDQVMAEQNLQAIFSPEGVATRAALGKLIKADVLAVVRKIKSADGKAELLDLLVFDVRSGLRLMTDAAADGGDPMATAAQFEGAFQQGVVKLDSKILDVCAVPTFLSQDLVFNFAYMAGTLARSVEGHLNHRKGLLLVELAEAKSLAEEAALGDAKVVRPLPLIVLGEYRNTGADKERRVSVTLKLKRGEKELGAVSKGEIMPDALSGALKELSDELLAKGQVALEQLPVDPQADIEQLVHRAQTLKYAGQWLDSAALYEAAIAIDPKSSELRLKAADVYANFVHANWLQARRDRDLAFTSLQSYRRAMEHVDVGARPTVPCPEKRTPDGSKWTEFWPTVTVELAMSEVQGMGQFTNEQKYREFYFDTFANDRQVMLNQCRLRAKLGYNDEVYALRWAVNCTLPPQRRDTVLGMIDELKDLPQGKHRVAAIALMGFESSANGPSFRLADDPEYLKQLENHKEDVFREALVEIRLNLKRREADVAAAKAKKDLENAALDKLGTLPLEQVTIHVASGDAKVAGKELRQFIRTIPLSGGTDLFVTGTGLYLMKQKGVVDQIWNRGPNDGGLRSVAFDGRHIWFATTNGTRPPRLRVLDPDDKSLQEFTADDGLPVIPENAAPEVNTQALLIAPLEKGKVFLVGSFGRAWLGIATLDAVAGKKVSVFHEARDKSTYQAGSDDWKKTTLAFEPRGAFVIEAPKDSPEAGQKRILIPREMIDPKGHNHALLVDPQAKTVSVDPHDVDRSTLMTAYPHNGSIYYCARHENFVGLLRYEFPGRPVSTDIRVPPSLEGTVVRGIDGDDIYMSDEKQWLVGSLSKKTVEPRARLTLLTMSSTSRSHHFGLLLGGLQPAQPPMFPQPRSTLFHLTKTPEVPVIVPTRND